MNKEFYWKLVDDLTEAIKKLPLIFYILEKDAVASAFALITASCRADIGNEAADDLAEHVRAKIDELGESFKDRLGGEDYGE